MTLLDEAMPQWHFGEVHRAEVRAAPDRTYAALFEVTARDVVLSRALLELRELGARVRGTAPRLGGPLAAGIEAAGFRRLAEAPGEEIVWGIVGRFWHPWRNIEPDQPADLDVFRAYAEPRMARAVWGFRFEPLPGGSTRVTTETRIAGTDAAARRRFRLYWLAVRPGSGLIRHDLLRALRRRAEEAPAA